MQQLQPRRGCLSLALFKKRFSAGEMFGGTPKQPFYLIPKAFLCTIGDECRFRDPREQQHYFTGGRDSSTVYHMTQDSDLSLTLPAYPLYRLELQMG